MNVLVFVLVVLLSNSGMCSAQADVSQPQQNQIQQEMDAIIDFNKMKDEVDKTLKTEKIEQRTNYYNKLRDFRQKLIRLSLMLRVCPERSYGIA